MLVLVRTAAYEDFKYISVRKYKERASVNSNRQQMTALKGGNACPVSLQRSCREPIWLQLHSGQRQRRQALSCPRALCPLIPPLGGAGDFGRAWLCATGGPWESLHGPGAGRAWLREGGSNRTNTGMKATPTQS
uniref:Uncharacterized protein n=1 Tax=Anser brachyrhynchus TaxID=132585 RepID=A0A8B9CU90_9AVES